MDRREKLIHSALNGDINDTSAKMLDETVRFILGDMGSLYMKFWDAEGPGVMCFQPQHERSVVYMTLEELHKAKESCEVENNDDLAETFRRILERAQKIDPLATAGYIINDEKGMRYLEIDYNRIVENA